MDTIHSGGEVVLPDISPTVIDWPVIPTPGNIDEMIAYKTAQLQFKSDSMVTQFIDYLKIIFGLSSTALEAGAI